MPERKVVTREMVEKACEELHGYDDPQVRMLGTLALILELQVDIRDALFEIRNNVDRMDDRQRGL